MLPLPPMKVDANAAGAPCPVTLPELQATVKPAGFPPRPDDERIWPSDGAPSRSAPFVGCAAVACRTTVYAMTSTAEC
jgi:hypothetical protein